MFRSFVVENVFIYGVENVSKGLGFYIGCQTERIQLLGTDRGGLICHKNFDKVAVGLTHTHTLSLSSFSLSHVLTYKHACGNPHGH